ncbi:MAG: plastocyanin/azurin family copper-binding protein [Actinomycetota bacterium]
MPGLPLRSIGLAGAVLAFSACGDSAGPVGPGLTVEAGVATYAEDAYDHPAGLIEVGLVNTSELAHTLLIEDEDGVDQGVRLFVGVEAPEDEVQIDLAPGTYLFFCDLPGHRLAGMEATVRID